MLVLIPSVFAFIAIADGVPSNSSPLDGKIVGGKLANITDYPYQLSLQFFSVSLCGASLLTPVRVLTAAHCAVRYNIGLLKVFGGGSRLYQYDGNKQISGVTKRWIHPKYVAKTSDNDVAVLAMAKPFLLNAAMQPIPLQAINQEIKPGTMCSIAGWGITKYKGESTNDLRAIEISVISIKECHALYQNKFISDRMLCLGYPQGEKDACKGDSGGAIVCEGKQVGIVSWGVGCAAPGSPTVTVKISNVEINTFITQHLR